uniref:Bcl-2 Bcl-2 homology region 1-3 domain-containing protein n=1 Tax=Oreochromis niloticus TaxID=8128 RepID=A0A669CH56_ORENI
MEHLPWTRDKHRCAACDLVLHSFVVGDTFVGEHIYHIHKEGKRCPYIDARYDRDEILYELGRQRSRRGQLAFPSRVLTAERGYSSVAGLERCLVCGVTTIQEKYLPSLGHDAWCSVPSLNVTSHHTTRALFSDGIINWGRIVSLVAYGTVLLQASKSTLWPECAYGIGVSIAAYITDNHMDWLVGTDGWDGFVDTFDRVHQRPWLSTQGKLFVFGVGLGLLSVLL